MNSTLIVRLVGEVKKWEDGKVGEQKRFSFLLCVFGWNGEKVGGWKTFLFGQREKWDDGKYSLYKLIIMSLLYNSGKVRGVGECNKVGVFV